MRFELRLDLSTRRLHCSAFTTEDPDSVEVLLFRQDHDAWQMPLGDRQRLNSSRETIENSTSTSAEQPASMLSLSGHEPQSGVKVAPSLVPENSTWLSVSAVLDPKVVQVAEVDTSRTFICEIVYRRLRPFPPVRSEAGLEPDHLFQRRVQIVNGE